MMKRLILATAVVLAAAITNAQAGSLVTMFAQAAAEAPAPAAPAAPAAKPAEPAPPAAAEPQAAPPAKPAPPETPKTVAASQKQDHKDYAEMELKECRGCHKGDGIAINHDGDWLRGHRLLAVKPNANCKSCHKQSFCLDCHKGGGIDVELRTEISKAGTAPESHRTDFKEIHPIKARDNPQTCARCHAARFCSECHEKFRGDQLQTLSHRRSWSDSVPSPLGPHGSYAPSACQSCHPNGFLPQNVWSADHAREARRNLQACQTCHSDGQTCMTCHSARTGLRMNPHPRGWNSVKDSYKKRSNGRSCIKCHDNY